MDREGWAIDDGFQRNALPDWVIGVCDRVFDSVQEYSVGSVEKSLRGGFEVGGLRVEDGQIEIGFEEAQDAVGFDDGILRGGDNFADARHGFGEMALLGADPPGVIGAGD